MTRSPDSSSSQRRIMRSAAGILLLAQMAHAEGRPLETEDPYQVLDQLAEAVATVEQSYYEPVARTGLLAGALHGLVAGLDPHSSYFTKQELAVFEGDTSGRFGGIGVEVDFRDGRVVVIAPVEGSPAARAGIGPGDVLVALNGEILESNKPDEVVQKMRGEIGTAVVLTIQKRGTTTAREVRLIREQIAVSSVTTAELDGGLGYLRIKSFQDGTHTEVLRGLRKLRRSRSGFHGLILDLRNNPGGLVREATAVADEFLSEGTIYSTRHRGDVTKTAYAHPGGAFASGVLVVLLNELSASAAELVLGALKDHRRAILVGARSFGKGSVQTVLPLPHGSAIKLTTALYYTPAGTTLQARGVLPHVTVNPGYASEGGPIAARESDLVGHIGTADKDRGPLQAAPPTNDQLVLGMARTIPANPTNGPDLALEVAYRIARGEHER